MSEDVLINLLTAKERKKERKGRGGGGDEVTR